MTKENMTVHEAINEVSSRIGSLAKEGFNQHQNYNFRGIDQLVTAVQPVLNEIGMTITPRVMTHESFDRVAEKIQRWCTVLVEYTITGPAGDNVKVTMVGEANDSADKAMNKALSNAAKYFYFQTFWFGVGGMDDGDFDHSESTPVRQVSQQNNSQPVRQAPKSNPQPASSGGGGQMSTEPQQRKIWAMAQGNGTKLGWNDSMMYQQIELALGEKIADLKLLTKAQAGRVIDAFQAQIDAGESGGNSESDF